MINQWVSLTEERNAVLVPAPGSGIPGAPANWDPPLGMETHIPVLFLDLNGKLGERIWMLVLYYRSGISVAPANWDLAFGIETCISSVLFLKMESLRKIVDVYT